MLGEDELLLKTGEKFGEIIAQSSFDLWQDKNFRDLINFDSISQTEQDRIFNELEVSVLGLFVINLDQAVGSSKSEELEIFYARLRQASVEGFLNLYKKLNLEQKHIHQWRILIDMRLEEYRKDFQIALKQSKKMKELKDDSDTRILWAKIETITIDCLSHVRRGDVQEGDPLWRMIRKWLTMMEVTLDKLTLQLSMRPPAES